MNKFTLLTMLSLCIFNFKGYAQNKPIERISSEYASTYSEEQKKISAYLSRTGKKDYIELQGGERAYIRRIDENGKPTYIKSYNAEAAITTGAAFIIKGGTFDMGVDGSGMSAGVWEIGDPNFSHQELIGHIKNVDGQSSRKSPSEQNHATHVMGTIAASGVYAQAKGMAPKAQILAYNSSSDHAEMAKAASEGLLISNHSYGAVTGWEGDTWYGDKGISVEEDYRFGFYSQDAKNLDKIAYNAPNYLIVWAAGNDRGNKPSSTIIEPDVLTRSDGPYDCIGPEAVAKNILTVGAVSHVLNYNGPTSVKMSSFSSWGPTDDGRIKPDIVANGIAVLSSGAGPTNGSGELELQNDYYYTSQGTSMAAPNAAGSLLLLQELYQRFYKKPMTAASLKALAIHTAKEAGDYPGPDYSFGWGLLDVENAAKVISNLNGNEYQLEEKVLKNEETFETTVTSDGMTPLTVTLSWTDVPGTPTSNQLDPETPMLVNDLDVRVYDESDNEYFPWIRQGIPFYNAAQKGDNTVDNVEKIEIGVPQAGTYRIVVSHKNTLTDNQQAFSLIITSSTPESTANTYYWLGGDNNWEDPENWSLESHGESVGSIPSAGSNVVFDQGVGAITLPESIELGNVYIYDSASIDFQVNKTVVIKGSIFNYTSTSTFKGDGKVILVANQANSQMLSENAHIFSSGGVEFTSDIPNAQWVLSDSLIAQRVLISGVSIELGGKVIVVDSLEIDVKDTDLVKTNQSTRLHVKKDLSVTNGKINIQGRLYAEGEFTISAPASTFGDFYVNTNTSVMTGLSFDKLLIEAGVSLNFPEGDTIKVNSLISKGTDTSPVSLTAASESILYSDKERRLCNDFLEISNVKAVGSTQFVSGNNSSLTNADGWVNKDCSDLLFADFELSYTCTEGLVKVTDLSTGNPEKWNWELLQEGVVVATYKGSIPDIIVNDIGTYTLKSILEKGSEMVSMEKSFDVIANTLTVPVLTYDGTVLRFTAQSGAKIKWYLDGEEIEGATLNFYINDTALSGDFYVVLSDDKCQVVSDTYTVEEVLAIDNDFQEMSVSLIPNPAVNTVSIKAVSEYQGIVKIKMFDITGTPIWDTRVDKSTTVLNEVWNCSELSSGIYLVKIAMGERVMTYRFVKL
ncbi:S8 family serine peptidase [Limibacter armeniacum]|uniref:S8 family serine peptidase n=1 Tax=Limibacter armeniacum TaxID=466084 RepID=UPI002FE57C8C